jgi:hypothetical protein
VSLILPAPTSSTPAPGTSAPSLSTHASMDPVATEVESTFTCPLRLVSMCSLTFAVTRKIVFCSCLLRIL